MQYSKGLYLALGLAAVAACTKNDTAAKSDSATAPPAAAPAPAPTAAPAAFTVTTIDLGKAVDADKKIASPTTSFSPKDTIYASIASDGSSPSVKIDTKWTFQDGQTVEEQTQTISPTGPAVTEFHIAKAKPWPAGKYKVEVLVNGTSAGVKEFDVSKEVKPAKSN
jgi:hypothetical protein